MLGAEHRLRRDLNFSTDAAVELQPQLIDVINGRLEGDMGEEAYHVKRNENTSGRRGGV